MSTEIPKNRPVSRRKTKASNKPHKFEKMRGSPCCSAARVLAARLREGHSQNQSWLASTRWKRCKAGSESEQFHQESGKTGFCQWQHIFPGCWPGLRGRISVWLGLQLLMLSFMGSKPNYTNPYQNNYARFQQPYWLGRNTTKKMLQSD